jgi:biopolymer transport protein ExbB/TolQ
MRAFHDMARTGSAGPSVVAAGVAEALFTTAAGLVVAVPSVMLYNHFLRRTHVMLTEAENHARDLRLSLDGAQDEARTTERGSRAA